MTQVTSVVEGLNVLGLVKADRVIAVLSVEHPGNGGAITRVFCDTSLLFGDLWLAFAVAKSADASYQDFCRQVQQLTKDADVAALVRGSLEGSKGLYILLPPQCETHR